MIYQKNKDNENKKFWDKKLNFKNFKSVDYDKVKNLIDKFNNYYIPNRYCINPKHHRYEQLLLFINNQRDLSFDERLVAYIELADPELLTYSLYLQSNITSLELINREESDYVKNEMIEERNFQITEYASKVRSMIGFYDNELITYEKKYKKKLVSENNNEDIIVVDNLMTGVNINYEFQLENYLESYKFNFSKVDFDTLKEKIYLYKECGYTRLDTIFHIMNQYKLLELHSIEERVAFLILCIDPQFILLKNYCEYSNWNDIKQADINEIGFCSEYFTMLEKELYNVYKVDDEKTLWL